MIEVYFFLHFLSSGEVEQSPYYDSLEEAIHDRGIMIKNFNVEQISPVIKGYIGG